MKFRPKTIYQLLQGIYRELTGYKNPPEATRFKTGDPKINRRGRPKSFKALRELVQSVGNGPAKDKNGDPLIIDGHIATVAEMIVRSWAKDPKRQRDFIEYGYGKVPNPVELTGEDGRALKVKVEYVEAPKPD